MINWCPKTNSVRLLDVLLRPVKPIASSVSISTSCIRGLHLIQNILTGQNLVEQRFKAAIGTIKKKENSVKLLVFFTKKSR